MSANRYPALNGEAVTQADSDYCKNHGHATHTIDGSDQPHCPRCGADKRAFGIHASLVAHAAINDGLAFGIDYGETVGFRALAATLAEMDLGGGFQSLSYQEQAAWILVRSQTIQARPVASDQQSILAARVADYVARAIDTAPLEVKADFQEATTKTRRVLILRRWDEASLAVLHGAVVELAAGAWKVG